MVKRLTVFGSVSFFISAAFKIALAITNIVVGVQSRSNSISDSTGSAMASRSFFGAADMFLGAMVCILFAAFLISHKKALAVMGSVVSILVYGFFMRYSALYQYSVTLWISEGNPVNMWRTSELLRQINLAILYIAMFVSILILILCKDKMPGSAVKKLIASISVVVFLPLAVMSFITSTKAFFSSSASLFNSLVYTGKMLNILFFLIALICLLINQTHEEKTPVDIPVIPKQKARVPEISAGPYIPPSQRPSVKNVNNTGSLI